MTNVRSASVLSYEIGSGTWSHPGDLVDHFGDPLPTDVIFFHPPPADMGRLISGHSTMRRGKETKPVSRRLLIASVFALPVTAFLTWFIYGADPNHTYKWLFLIPAAACMTILAIVWRRTAFHHVCSYVSADGMTSYQLRGRRHGVANETRFLFRTATELRTKQTHNYANGIYMGTKWEFKWTNAAGQLAYFMEGTHFSHTGNPTASSPFCFGRSGEVAWTDHLLRTLDAQLTKRGYVEFNAGGANDVRVGRSFLEFKWGSETARINVDEIKTVQLHEGKFHIAHKDAGWFSRRGKFNFPYESVANARLFLLTVDRLLGLKLAP